MVRIVCLIFSCLSSFVFARFVFIFSFYCKGIYLPYYKSDIVLVAILCQILLTVVFFSPYMFIFLCLSGVNIQLGKATMFHFNHPQEAAQLREKRKVGEIHSLLKLFVKNYVLKTLLDKG